MPSWRIDLHVHGERSPDSTATFSQYAERMAQAGLYGFALTDHNAVPPAPLLAQLRERYPRYLFLSGVEVSAQEGHVLVYGVETAPSRGIALEELVEWAHARNAVVALAHPLRRFHGAGRRVAEGARVDALEGRNGRMGFGANSSTERLGVSRHLAVIGGSDAHETGSLGRAYTEFADEPPDSEAVLDAIRHQRTLPGGQNLSAAGRLSVGLRNLRLRTGRGFRSV
ncbi:MAG: CehA/McbA family metallohydrolase [Thermoplasmata archaeon]|nr:CehA/McbA family metallohydrolase [Thermoplasmata archaeon]